MDCPRCKLALNRERYEGVEAEICPGCWGMWLDRGELESVIRSRGLEFSEEERRRILEMRGPSSLGPRDPVACPRCSSRMERIYLDPSLYLVIDRCALHGVWLDTGEVKAIQAAAEGSREMARLLLSKLRGRSG